MRTSLLLSLMIASAPVSAQRVTLTAPVDLLHAPGGRVLGTLRAGALLTPGASRGGFVQVTLQGYVSSSMLGAPRDSFAVTVKEASTQLRTAAQAGSQSLATLRQGMGLNRLRIVGDWAEVSRSVWIRESAVRAVTPPSRTAAPTPRAGDATRSNIAARPASPDPVRASASASRAQTAPARALEAGGSGTSGADSADLVAIKGGTLRNAPSGASIATLGDSARLQALFRERGWVKVRVEGWVKEEEVTESDTALRAALLPADLRADPAGTRGKVVRWDVQKLAIQNADPLQRDLAQNEPYMLARGPGADHPLLYLSLPPSLMTAARTVPPLGFFTVVARVRSGRSSPGGVPILDVISIATK